jgi:hypothetical protein
MVVITVEPTVNSAVPTLDKWSERKLDVSLLSGDSCCYGLPASFAAFHAVWTVAKTQKSYVPNVNKSNKQSQLTSVDFHQPSF